MIEVTFASDDAVHEILFIMISASRFLEMDYLLQSTQVMDLNSIEKWCDNVLSIIDDLIPRPTQSLAKCQQARTSKNYLRILQPHIILSLRVILEILITQVSHNHNYL